MTLEQRFWKKVRITPGCWEWTAYKVKAGYGIFRVGGTAGDMVPAHRVAYELLVGPIGQKLCIDHLCRNPSCVNPAHMEPVTRAENVMRGIGHGPVNAAKTHCKRGHIFDAANTYVDPHGKRSCRPCKAMLQREYLQRRARHSHI